MDTYSRNELNRASQTGVNMDNPIGSLSIKAGAKRLRIDLSKVSFKSNKSRIWSNFSSQSNPIGGPEFVSSGTAFDPRVSRNVAADLVRAETEKCTTLATLQEGWDGESAQPIKEETAQRAVSFLISHVLKALNQRKRPSIPRPKVGPVADGSIDLYWKTPHFRFLVNIPASKDTSASYFGERFGGSQARGLVPPGGTCDLLLNFLNV